MISKIIDIAINAIEKSSAEGFAKIVSEHKDFQGLEPSTKSIPTNSAEELEPFGPDFPDLAVLYDLITETKRFSVLEFGSGYSTWVVAVALKKLASQYSGQLKDIRFTNPFTAISVETNESYLAKTMERIPLSLRQHVTPFLSGVQTVELQGRLATRYEKLPQVNPDFIYLDGPGLFCPENLVSGISTAHPDFMPMSADLLLIEHFLVPGTIVLVDGRTANARFLKANFQRNWFHKHFTNQDQHLFILDESPLGSVNVERLRYYVGS